MGGKSVFESVGKSVETIQQRFDEWDDQVKEKTDGRLTLPLLLGLFFILFLLSGYVFLFSNPGQDVTLHVTDTTGKPLNGATVRFFDSNGNLVASGKTLNGTVTIKGLPMQKYTYTVSLDGYDSVRSQYDPANPNSAHVQMNSKTGNALNGANSTDLTPPNVPPSDVLLPGSDSTGAGGTNPGLPPVQTADGQLTVNVKDATSHQPISQVTVSLYDGTTQTFLVSGLTDAQGVLLAGVRQKTSVTVKATADGYAPAEPKTVPINGPQSSVDLFLASQSSGNAVMSSFNVSYSNGTAATGALLQVFSDVPSIEQFVPDNGSVSVLLQKGISYTARASMVGFQDAVSPVSAGDSVSLVLNVNPSSAKSALVLVSLAESNGLPSSNSLVGLYKKVGSVFVKVDSTTVNSQGVSSFGNLLAGWDVLLNATSAYGTGTATSELTLVAGSNPVAMVFPASALTGSPTPTVNPLQNQNTPTPTVQCNAQGVCATLNPTPTPSVQCNAQGICATVTPSATPVPTINPNCVSSQTSCGPSCCKSGFNCADPVQGICEGNPSVAPPTPSPSVACTSQGVCTTVTPSPSPSTGCVSSQTSCGPSCCSAGFTCSDSIQGICQGTPSGSATPTPTPNPQNTVQATICSSSANGVTHVDSNGYTYTLVSINAAESAAFQVTQGQATVCPAFSPDCLYILGQPTSPNQAFAKITHVDVTLTSIDPKKSCVNIDLSTSCVGDSCTKTSTCPTTNDPVCGSNGVTYTNACFATAASVSAYASGICTTQCSQQYDPVCADNGIQYPNACLATQDQQTFKPGVCTYSQSVPFTDVPPGWSVVSPMGAGSIFATDCTTSFRYVFQSFDPASKSYSPVLPTLGASISMQYGNGYFVYSDKACRIYWNDQKATEPYQRTLSTGWNLIGAAQTLNQVKDLLGTCTTAQFSSQWGTSDTTNPVSSSVSNAPIRRLSLADYVPTEKFDAGSASLWTGTPRMQLPDSNGVYACNQGEVMCGDVSSPSISVTVSGAGGANGVYHKAALCCTLGSGVHPTNDPGVLTVWNNALDAIRAGYNLNTGQGNGGNQFVTAFQSSGSKDGLTTLNVKWTSYRPAWGPSNDPIYNHPEICTQNNLAAPCNVRLVYSNESYCAVGDVGADSYVCAIAASPFVATASPSPAVTAPPSPTPSVTPSPTPVPISTPLGVTTLGPDDWIQPGHGYWVHYDGSAGSSCMLKEQCKLTYTCQPPLTLAESCTGQYSSTQQSAQRCYTGMPCYTSTWTQTTASNCQPSCPSGYAVSGNYCGVYPSVPDDGSGSTVCSTNSQSSASSACTLIDKSTYTSSTPCKAGDTTIAMTYSPNGCDLWPTPNLCKKQVTGSCAARVNPLSPGFPTACTESCTAGYSSSQNSCGVSNYACGGSVQCQTDEPYPASGQCQSGDVLSASAPNDTALLYSCKKKTVGTCTTTSGTCQNTCPSGFLPSVDSCNGAGGYGACTGSADCLSAKPYYSFDGCGNDVELDHVPANQFSLCRPATTGSCGLNLGYVGSGGSYPSTSCTASCPSGFVATSDSCSLNANALTCGGTPRCVSLGLYITSGDCKPGDVKINGLTRQYYAQCKTTAAGSCGYAQNANGQRVCSAVCPTGYASTAQCVELNSGGLFKSSSCGLSSQTFNAAGQFSNPFPCLSTTSYLKTGGCNAGDVQVGTIVNTPDIQIGTAMPLTP